MVRKRTPFTTPNCPSVEQRAAETRKTEYTKYLPLITRPISMKTVCLMSLSFTRYGCQKSIHPRSHDIHSPQRRRLEVFLPRNILVLLDRMQMERYQSELLMMPSHRIQREGRSHVLIQSRLTQSLHFRKKQERNETPTSFRVSISFEIQRNITSCFLI